MILTCQAQVPLNFGAYGVKLDTTRRLLQTVNGFHVTLLWDYKSARWHGEGMWSPYPCLIRVLKGMLDCIEEYLKQFWGGTQKRLQTKKERKDRTFNPVWVSTLIMF